METLEPLLDAIRSFLTGRGWPLSGVQKTTSYEYEGPWEGYTLRSAYAFFHGPSDSAGPDGEGEGAEGGPSIEAFVDETEDGVEASLSLVIRGPTPAEEPDVRRLLGRAIEIAAACVPDELPAPVTVSFSSPGRTAPDRASTRIRFKARVPTAAVLAGDRTVKAALGAILDSFERVLEEWPGSG